MTPTTRDVVRHYRAELFKLPVRGEGIRKLTARQKIAKAEAEGLPTASPGTVNTKLRALSTVLSYAEKYGHLGQERNPVIAGGFLREAAKAITRRKAMAPRKHYTREELAVIFGSPAFAEGWEPPRARFGKAWYWLPLLMYYTGARVEEIAQLAVRDVKAHGAAWYLSILNTEGEEDGDRGVKTASSRRNVPVHPDLVRLGFTCYIESLPASGQLFPGFEKVPQGLFQCHGFRHAFKTFCRDGGIHEEIHDSITGHSGGNRVARGYGEVSLDTLTREIARYPSAPIMGLEASP